jgi:hypothetical protein
VKRAAIAVSMSLSMAPSAAFAVDWAVKATQSETVEANSNQFLATIPAGTLGSYTTLSANAEARTPDSKFDFDADGTYRKYWGPGTVNTSESEATNWGFKAHYETDGKNNFDREFIETSWRQQSTALALLNDLGISSNVSGALDRLTAAGGIDRSLSARDSLNLLATSTFTSYEPSSGGTSFTDTLGRATWRHSLSSVTALTASSEVELLNYDNAFGTNVEIFRNQVGVQATLSPVLSFRGEAGAVNVITQNGVGTSSLIAFGGPSTALPISSSVTDWIGDAVLTYKMFKDTTFTLNASQSVGPSIVGSLFKRDLVSAGLARSINNHSRLSFSASINQQTSTSTTEFASASITYGYDFTKDWTAQLTYRYLHRFASTGTATIDPITNTPTTSGTGPADSHSILVVVSHSYTVLPRGN